MSMHSMALGPFQQKEVRTKQQRATRAQRTTVRFGAASLLRTSEWPAKERRPGTNEQYVVITMMLLKLSNL